MNILAIRQAFVKLPDYFDNKRLKIIAHVILAGILFLRAVSRLSEIGQMILYSDEFGYWAGSAYLLGQDWSSITAKIGYYSYGYGLLLVPVRLIGRWRQWGWQQTYQAGVVLNALMLLGSFCIALRLTKRYFGKMNWLLRAVVCFAAMIYPSNIIYAHITWTECTLTFLFWIFLYCLMRVTDRPGVANHIGIGLVSFYIYVVHQRAFAVLLTAVLIVLYMSLTHRNKISHVAAFFGSIFVWSVVHAMLKGGLQNDFYLANPPAGLREYIGYAVSAKNIALLGGGAVLLVILYLLDRKKIGARTLAVLLAAAFAGGVFLVRRMPIGGAQDVDYRIAVNDFAGQWAKIVNLLTVKGLIRLGISIAGKWFYLAAGTGLVVCWGIKDLVKHAFHMLIESCKIVWAALAGRREKAGELIGGQTPEDIWKLGLFLSWIGTFLICAIYKEGFYKVDDLVHGRYNEFLLGMMLIYSVYALTEDRKWIRTAIICVVLYCMAGALCQYCFDEVQRTDFELAHATMFGRVIWNWEVPYDKVRQISVYVLPMGFSFIVLIKFLSERFPKVKPARCVLALLIPIIAWNHLASEIVDKYVVVRNEKQAHVMPTISMWAGSMGGKDVPVYYLEDTLDYRWAEGMQFMMMDSRTVTLVKSADAPFDEDAFFIMHTDYAGSDAVREKCETVLEVGHWALVVNKEQELKAKWDHYFGKEEEQTQETSG